MLREKYQYNINIVKNDKMGLRINLLNNYEIIQKYRILFNFCLVFPLLLFLMNIWNIKTNINNMIV